MSVASTYAEALYEAAEAEDVVPAVTSDLEAFVAARRDSAELRAVLDNPEIDTEAKKAVVTALSADAQPLLRNFLLVLLDRGRITELPEIAEAYARKAAEAEGRLEVHAVTAVPLPDDLRARIVERLEGQTGRTIDLETSVDHEIVGGLVLRVGGAALDASVRQRVEDLRAQMLRAPIDAAIAASPSDTETSER